MLAQLVNSNAVQLAAVAAAGGAGYLVAARWPAIIAAVGFATAAALAVSFAFEVGEVYSYAGLYKRAFWHLTDGVTTWLTPILIWAVLARRRALAVAVACGILLSGTKIALVLLVLQYGAILVVSPGRRREVTRTLWTALAVGVVVYLGLVLASPHLVAGTGGRPLPQRCDSGADCLATQLARPLLERGVSSAAGLWMTLAGGFAGAEHPATPEAFADLMVAEDPWGLSDRFGIDRAAWLRMRTVQTPYLRFGAGYGLLPLVALLAAIAALCWLAIGNLRCGESDPLAAFSVFFVVNAVFNQTQPWISRGAILFVMGFSAAHILTRRLSRHPNQRARAGA